MFENPRRGRQGRNFKTNVPKILDLDKPSSEQIFSEIGRWVLLKYFDRSSHDVTKEGRSEKLKEL